MMYLSHWIATVFTIRHFIKIAKRMMRFIDQDDAANLASKEDTFLRILFHIIEFLCVAILGGTFTSFGLENNAVLCFQMLNYFVGCCAFISTICLVYQHWRIFKIISNASKLFSAQFPNSLDATKSLTFESIKQRCSRGRTT